MLSRSAVGFDVAWRRPCADFRSVVNSERSERSETELYGAIKHRSNILLLTKNTHCTAASNSFNKQAAPGFSLWTFLITANKGA